jgi:hydrogenase maturation protein HypF
MTGITRRTFEITGTVQGVGFRPTLYRLARDAKLGGWVQNRSGAVVLALEGAPADIDAFVETLPSAIPASASIEALNLVDEDSTGDAGISPFHIKESGLDSQSEVTIPADLAMCPECRAEVLDPTNRRYGYPFTTCTNCGPRYTVVHGMPYDRERTTLNSFPLCEACNREYRDPTNRRFHAESTACPDCGPSIAFRLETTDHRLQTTAPPSSTVHAPLSSSRHVLASGGILAIRGMGGFHLAVDATHPEAIAKLRERKHRPAKPFAVMARNLDVVRSICRVSEPAADLLQSPEAPIVILDIRLQTTDCRLKTTDHSLSLERPTLHSPQSTVHSPLPTSLISPDTHTLGVMLPTTPLHMLLHEGGPDDPTPPFDFLIMTSGNQSSEPICISNDEAEERLQGIADAFLFHDREINLRNDDSLVAEQTTGLQLWRRARGYAPNPTSLQRPLSRSVLAMGAELKNAIAIGDGDRVTLSPHIGDLSTPEARDAHERVARELPQFLDRTPDCIAVDLHPDMHCTRHGEQIAATLDIPVVSVQHHHAHAAACLAENGRTSGLALVFDGTGLGPDGTIWGAELLHVEGAQFTRLATFAPTHLPGGDMAVAEPTRQLVARWHAAGIVPSPKVLKRCGIREDQHTVWTQQCDQGINAPLTHAAGRLFDAFAALIGFAPARTSYEGQAPIRLEAAAHQGTGSDTLPFETVEQEGFMTIDWSPALRALVEKHADVWQNPSVALQIHRTIADAAAKMIAFGVEQAGEKSIALSGGVFMNRLLCELLIPKLKAQGLTVLTHSRVPPNDGGIALGQAIVAGCI